MTTLLHIDASPRGARSLSRDLSLRFVKQWLAHEPYARLLYRDVGRNPPPLISEDWIAAAFTPEASRTPEQTALLAYSEAAIAELAQADVIVLGTPMHNYGMPTALKAWFDQVIRINRTFSFDLARGDWPLEPIMRGKTLVILASSGEFGFEAGGVREDRNHLVPHILTCAHYLGVETHHVVAVEYQEFGDDRHRQSVADAQAAVGALAARLAGRVVEDCTVE